MFLGGDPRLRGDDKPLSKNAESLARAGPNLILVTETSFRQDWITTSFDEQWATPISRTEVRSLSSASKKRPCKNLQGFKIRNFFSCEQSKAADPKPYKSYGERSRTPLCEANGKITYQ